MDGAPVPHALVPSCRETAEITAVEDEFAGDAMMVHGSPGQAEMGCPQGAPHENRRPGAPLLVEGPQDVRPFLIQLELRIVAIRGVPAARVGIQGDRAGFDLEDEHATPGTRDEEVPLPRAAPVVPIGESPADQPVVIEFREEFCDLHLGAVAAFGWTLPDEQGHGMTRCSPGPASAQRRTAPSAFLRDSASMCDYRGRRPRGVGDAAPCIIGRESAHPGRDGLRGVPIRSARG